MTLIPTQSIPIEWILRVTKVCDHDDGSTVVVIDGQPLDALARDAALRAVELTHGEEEPYTCEVQTVSYTRGHFVTDPNPDEFGLEHLVLEGEPRFDPLYGRKLTIVAIENVPRTAPAHEAPQLARPHPTDPLKMIEPDGRVVPYGLDSASIARLEQRASNADLLKSDDVGGTIVPAEVVEELLDSAKPLVFTPVMRSYPAPPPIEPAQFSEEKAAQRQVAYGTIGEYLARSPISEDPLETIEEVPGLVDSPIEVAFGMHKLAQQFPGEPVRDLERPAESVADAEKCMEDTVE